MCAFRSLVYRIGKREKIPSEINSYIRPFVTVKNLIPIFYIIKYCVILDIQFNDFICLAIFRKPNPSVFPIKFKAGVVHDSIAIFLTLLIKEIRSVLSG